VAALSPISQLLHLGRDGAVYGVLRLHTVVERVLCVPAASAVAAVVAAIGNVQTTTRGAFLAHLFSRPLPTRATVTPVWTPQHEPPGGTSGLRFDECLYCVTRAITSLAPHLPDPTGKTAAVRALAAELGFEVLEVSAAMVRSRRTIVEAVGEATRSRRLQQRTQLAALSEIPCARRWTSSRGCSSCCRHYVHNT